MKFGDHIECVQELVSQRYNLVFWKVFAKEQQLRLEESQVEAGQPGHVEKKYSLVVTKN